MIAALSQMSGHLTPVHAFSDWFAKREDFAGLVSPEYPSGAKVRQYFAMSDKSPDASMIVGCSADSAMQIYVAAAAKLRGVPGIIYVSARRNETAATKYARKMGAEVNLVSPGYLSVVRSRAKERAKSIGNVVRWSPAFAVIDTAEQCANLPDDVTRVVVPVGTGAIAAGILVGLSNADRVVPILGVAVSRMATVDTVCASASRATDKPLPPFDLIYLEKAYSKPVSASLPDGTLLDPFYAAKALPFIISGDCLWISGVRPAMAMPL